MCRKLEKKWYKSELTVNDEIFKAQHNHVKSLHEEAKAMYMYIQGKLDSATSHKDTFAVLNCLMHKKSDQAFPEHDNTSVLAEQFTTFFTDKIPNVRNELSTD